jgi:hypothetical protein
VLGAAKYGLRADLRGDRMRPVRAGAWILMVLIFGGACGTAESMPAVELGLVSADELPGDWTAFGAQSGEGPLCGVMLPDTDVPLKSASVAMAIDPMDGPIFGQRIERYRDADAARAALRSDVQLPCEFTSTSGSRWRMERLDPPTVASSGRVFLITSLDRPDSYNYEVAIASGDVVVLAVLNVRQPARELLDELIEIAWSKADRAGLLSDER